MEVAPPFLYFLFIFFCFFAKLKKVFVPLALKPKDRKPRNLNILRYK